MREKEARKRELLNSAIRLFSEQGFVKTSMELIANDVALAVGTLYRYYKSKEALFVSIVFEAVSAMHSGLEEIAGMERSPEEKLKLIWDYFFQFHEQNPMYYQALLFLHDPSFARAFGEVEQRSFARFSTKNFRLLGRVIQDGMDNGLFHRGNPHQVADFLWSAFVGLVNLIEARRQFGSAASHLGEAHSAMWGNVRRAVVVEHQSSTMKNASH